MKKNKHLLGLPSGEILHVKGDTIYNLALSGLVNYRAFVGSERVECYCFRDILREDIKKIIFDCVEQGDKIEHKRYGIGKISAVLINDVGYLVEFSDIKRPYQIDNEIKLYITKEMLLAKKEVKLL